MEHTSIRRGRTNLMKERRTRLEIYIDVLIAIRGGHQRKEQIMSEVEISPNNLDEILESLASLEFIEATKVLDWSCGDVSVHYRFSTRGENLMRYLAEHDETLNDRELGEYYL